jgi:hypothetical protein
MFELKKKSLFIYDFIALLKLKNLKIYETNEITEGDELITWIGGIDLGPLVEIKLDHEACSLKVFFGTVSPESADHRKFLIDYFQGEDMPWSNVDDEMELFYTMQIPLDDKVQGTLINCQETISNTINLCKEFKNYSPAFTDIYNKLS